MPPQAQQRLALLFAAMALTFMGLAAAYIMAHPLR
jgi:hypothetical protein